MQEATPTILIIEDDPVTRYFLSSTLSTNEYQVIETVTAQEGLAAAAERHPDVLLLDLGLPDLDGIEVIKRVRAWTAAPIIVLSARGQEHDKVGALDAGADDYLTKPFGVGELLSRLRVALRHAARANQGEGEPVFTVGELRIDLARRQVLAADAEIHLTPIEYKLLTTLVRHCGQVLTHRQLLQEVWGPAYAKETNYLRVYVKQLRDKLEPVPASPRYLLTEPGVGYRLAPEC